MTLWRPGELAAATGGRFTVPFAASGVAIDSRTLSPGALFVALHGESRDGHQFVADAFARGAAGALVERPLPGLGPLLVVEDTLAALAGLARFARGRFCGRLVAVTGSVGKTTTKEMLRLICAAHGQTHAAEGSHNNQWGVPLTLARLPESAAWCVVEIGSNHPGEIAPLARLARPDVAVVTAVEKVHIGLFGSLEAIADEKISIVTGLQPAGSVVLPADSPLLPRLLAGAAGHEVASFGVAAAAAGRLLAARVSAEATEVEAVVAGAVLHFTLPAPGRHLALDAVAALLAAQRLGADPQLGAAALATFSPLGGRGERRRLRFGDGEVLLLDESHNASAVAVRGALAVLACQKVRRRIAVLGDMLELGAEAEAEHLSLVPAVVEAADLLFTCGPQMAALQAAVPPALRGGHAADSAALAPLVTARLRAGDGVLVKGSLGSRMALVVQAIAARAEGAA
jgi:UDP-N-acetylmuramoyl-tripeptide--D-alanyl-D-alanine ligase